ncbi:MAG: hypothetical protein HKO59_05895 [Phycisphaerales bacterium]|nr:hypothetical protein [Phycisphaerales bacterium]
MQRPVTMALVLAFVLGGCVERDEEITVDADGTVRVHLEFASDSFDDLYQGDAVPSVAGGWLVEERTERDVDGAERFRLIADAVFGPETALPSTYADPRDPDPQSVLHFVTTLTIEPRPDGVYYHFARVYPPRPWAYLDHARALLEEHAGSGDEFAAMTPEEQRDRVLLYARVGAVETQVFVRRAFRATLPELPPDAWLHLHGVVGETVDGLDVGPILAALAVEDEQERAAQLERRQTEMLTMLETTIQRTLRRDLGVDPGGVNAFMRAYRVERTAHEITQDLGDDSFTVTVQMPGTLVGHNGEGADGTRVTWRFGGTMLRDREHELVVSSVVRR